MRDAPETRHSLLARLHGIDSDLAWTEFVRLYEPAIYRYSRRQGLQDADAREICQEVLLSVRALASDPPKAKKERFRAWLATVARNRVIDFVRKKARDKRIETQLPHPLQPSDSNDPLAREVRHQMFVHASEIVKQKVSEVQWLSFWKTTIELMPPTDVADCLGISVGNVYVSKCRVMEKLRREIDRMTQSEWSVDE